jgi:phosphatidylglycerophosphatase A
MSLRFNGRQPNVNSMKDQKIQDPHPAAVLFLSWFYTGKFPKAPGTIGSLATLPLIYLLHYLNINIYGLIGLILILFISSVLVTQHIQKAFNLHDPQWIVIDEVIGMLVTWAFVMKIEFASLFLVFGLFRLFDIIKIWPASYFDRLHHGLGTIADDVISGLYAGIIALFLEKFF